jgi:outer membrane murein-binding lipoprotein Lpp
LSLISSDADSLLTLHVSVLSRALSPILRLESSDPAFDRRHLFDFLVRCLDHYGAPASVLFRDVSADAFTPIELATLDSHPHFQWCFISPSVGTALIGLMSECEKQRRALSSLSDGQSALISSLASRVSELDAKVDRLSDELNARTAAADSRFEAAIGRETASIESKFQTELRALTAATDARFAAQIAEQGAALNARFQALVKQEITSIDSKFGSALQSQISAAEARIQKDLRAQSSTAIAHCESEIQKQAAATISRLESASADGGARNVEMIRVELREQSERLRSEIRPLIFLLLHDSPLDGIIAWLGRRCDGNVIDKSVIVASPGKNPRSVFDYQDSNTYYYHNHGPYQWLAIDFQQMRVYATDYSIRAHPVDATCIPKSWVLEGSNDGTAWFPLDTRTDCAELRDTSLAFTFTVSNPRLCRHLRFRKTEGWHDGCTGLYLMAIEFFGVVTGIFESPSAIVST